MGIEPTLSAWKAEVLPLNYTRFLSSLKLVEGEGFEPSKAEPSDLQSDPFDRSGTPPKRTLFSFKIKGMSIYLLTFPLLRWCWHQESNPGPTDYKSVALPTELRQHVRFYILM
ncbi:hypothetical protein Lsha_1260 [Legionella shakespearei DSM 23087]|uniref:Uncharacterized protein n=1 Tax=Legionella shakespearei DSM 23087 TaxID=1122169 RepID=A0A0W0YVS3_9GAMM|nr:hypothetical protein Lsha_1260 [Legionella shakespearei DSM 23087]